MHFIYCPHCGEKLKEREIGDEGLVPYCERCQKPLFDMPDACTIALAVNEYGEAALLRQDYVSKTGYVCIAGHIKPGERAEETAAREIEEEIGIRPESVTYLGSYTYPKRGLLMLGFFARVKKAEFHLSGEVDAAAWFPVREAPSKVRTGSIAWQLIMDYLERTERREA